MVGMRSCASGVARPKKGAKVRNVEASKKEPQPRKCKSAYAERQEEASSRAAPDARERIPTGAGDETVGPIISPMHTNGGLFVSSFLERFFDRSDFDHRAEKERTPFDLVT
jgi:hypothetical protein